MFLLYRVLPPRNYLGFYGYFSTPTSVACGPWLATHLRRVSRTHPRCHVGCLLSQLHGAILFRYSFTHVSPITRGHIIQVFIYPCQSQSHGAILFRYSFTHVSPSHTGPYYSGIHLPMSVPVTRGHIIQVFIYPYSDPIAVSIVKSTPQAVFNFLGPRAAGLSR